MVNLQTIGDKNAILLKKMEQTDIASHMKHFAQMKESRLGEWVDEYFSGLPEDVREGLEIIVKALWANAKVLQKLQPGE